MRNRLLNTVVLQIHNASGERHTHTLEVGKDEEPPDAKLDISRYYPPHIFHMFDGRSRGPSTFPHLTIALVHTRSLSAPHFPVATLMRYYRRFEFGCTHPKGRSNCQHHHARSTLPHFRRT